MVLVLGSSWGSVWASFFSLCRPAHPACCTLFCGSMSEAIWAAALLWPPHLRLAEWRSGSRHLAQRVSELISGGRAKGWRPWPDPPEKGVCAKRFYSEWGKRGRQLLQQLHGHPAVGPSAHNIGVSDEKCLSCLQIKKLKWYWSLDLRSHLFFMSDCRHIHGLSFNWADTFTSSGREHTFSSTFPNQRYIWNISSIPY